MLCKYTTYQSSTYTEVIVPGIWSLGSIQENNVLKSYNDLPSLILYHDDEGTNKYFEEWHQNNLRHREDDKPAFIGYWQNGEKYCKQYYTSGKRNRAIGYAYINMFDDRRLVMSKYDMDAITETFGVAANAENSVDNY